MSQYPARTPLVKILGDVTADPPADISTEEFLASFKTIIGTKAAPALATYLDKVGAELIADDDKVAGASLNAVARQARAFFMPGTQFARVKLVQHTIAEDGDLESNTLIAENRDGSLVVLSYTHFPF